MLWPKIVHWNPWLEKQIQSLCENRVNTWTGCAASGKTYAGALFGFVFWLCDPKNTSVILTSTELKMVKVRIWPVIQELFHAVPGMVGNLVGSQTILQSIRGDYKRGVFGMAVAEGPVEKAKASMQGVHNKRMMVMIDEATDVQPALFEVILNLRKGCDEFVSLINGNALSILDPHGQASEPKKGWSSITVDDFQWDTKGVAKWGIDPGVCLHFDGSKSPNLGFSNPPYPFLYTNADFERDKTVGLENIGYWKYGRGFWAPEGICKTVFSESMLVMYDARGQHTFKTKSFDVAALDPAFGGGDKCVLQFGKIGDLSSGKMAIQLNEAVSIYPKATLDVPVHFQIARQVIDQCKAKGITPDHFAMDSSGEGGGLADIIANEWSNSFLRVEFGGAPSDLPVSDADHRTGKEVYDRRVTELWYSCRNLLQSGLLKGLPEESCIEFCNRQFSDEKRKIRLDTKVECKKKIGHSPDNADAVVVLSELARSRLGVMASSRVGQQFQQQWQQAIEENNQIYINSDYAEV